MRTAGRADIAAVQLQKVIRSLCPYPIYEICVHRNANGPRGVDRSAADAAGNLRVGQRVADCLDRNRICRSAVVDRILRSVCNPHRTAYCQKDAPYAFSSVNDRAVLRRIISK